MKRCLAFLLALALAAGEAFGYSGSCGIWAQKRGDFYPRNFAGDQTGFDAAKTYVGTSGVIQIGDGCGGNITTGSLGDSVMVLMSLGGRWVVRGTVVTGRFGPESTDSTGGAIRIIDGRTFSFTDDGVRAAYNEVKAAGGGTVLMPRGRYIWDNTVIVLDAKGVTFQGQGDSTAIFGDYTSGTDAFEVQGTSSGITFRDFLYDGDWQNNTAGRGIDCISSSAYDLTIENVTITRTNDAAIASQAPRTTIRNCRIYEIGDASAGDRYGIRLSGSGADSSVIDGNEVSHCRDGTLVVDGGNDWISIRGNRLMQPQGYGSSNNVSLAASGSASKGFSFVGNTVAGTDTGLVVSAGVDSSRIENNTITGSRIYSGLYLTRGNGVVISGNICTANVHNGIFIGFDGGDCSNVLVTGNYCAGNQGSGITVNPSTTRTFTNIAILGNQLVNNGAYGISVSPASFASSAVIGGNVMESNTSGATSLSGTNWTYLGLRFDSPIRMRNLGSYNFDDTGGASQPFVTTAGTNQPRFRPLATGSSIFFQNFAGDTTSFRIHNYGGVQYKWGTDNTTNSWVDSEGSRNWSMTPGSARTLTTVAGLHTGGVITIIFGNGNTTINETGNINLSSTPWTPGAGDVLELTYDGTTAKWVEVGRSDN